MEKMREQQADLKIQTAQLSTQFGPAYPKVAQLNNQMKEMDAQIQTETIKVVSRRAQRLPRRPAAREPCCARPWRTRNRRPTS